MAMHRNHNFVDARNFLMQSANQLPVFLRHGVANRIRNIDGSSARPNNRFHHLAQKRDISSRSILRRKFHVRTQRLRVSNRIPRLLQTLLACDSQLVFQMNVGGREKNMDARVGRSLQSLPGAINISRASASQPRNNWTPHRSGNPLHRLKVAIRSDRKARFNHVHAKSIQLLGQSQFLLHIHTAARRLFAISKRSVEYSDPRSINRSKLHVGRFTALLYRRRGLKDKIIIFTTALVITILLDELMHYVVIWSSVKSINGARKSVRLEGRHSPNIPLAGRPSLLFRRENNDLLFP